MSVLLLKPLVFPAGMYIIIVTSFNLLYINPCVSLKIIIVQLIHVVSER